MIDVCVCVYVIVPFMEPPDCSAAAAAAVSP